MACAALVWLRLVGPRPVAARRPHPWAFRAWKRRVGVEKGAQTQRAAPLEGTISRCFMRFPRPFVRALGLGAVLLQFLYFMHFIRSVFEYFRFFFLALFCL